MNSIVHTSLIQFICLILAADFCWMLSQCLFIILPAIKADDMKEQQKPLILPLKYFIQKDTPKEQTLRCLEMFNKTP